MKKVLIITYYWPPSGGGGVQRWLKFVKYLREFNWDPVIYTPENPDFELQDKALLDDVPKGITVLKRPIWEPFAVYRMILGKKAVQKQGVVAKSSNSIFSKFSIWIRGNYFIPDARVFWVRPSVNYLGRYLKKNKIDVIVTTGPPHSIHLIGLELKKRLDIKWLADFRDPWSKWDVLDQLNLSNKSRKNHQKLEQRVLTRADHILTVSRSLKTSLQNLGAYNIDVITNGFDFDPRQPASAMPDKFRIAHLGLLNTGRNPLMLWQCLHELAEQLPGFVNDLEINLSGTIEDEVLTTIKAYANLAPCLQNVGYLSHDKVLGMYEKSYILLLLINNTDNAKWILPGKMYEYMAQQRPILALGSPESDASDILTEVGYSPCIRYNDLEMMKKFIKEAYTNYKDGKTTVFTGDIMKYHRRTLTKSLAACLDQL